MTKVRREEGEGVAPVGEPLQPSCDKEWYPENPGWDKETRDVR